MDEAAPVTTDDRRITPGRVAATVVVVALVAMWVYAFSGLAAKDPPDLLDDPAFSVAAEPICADAVDRLDTLTPALEADTPEERAATVARANAILTAMVDDLRAIAPDDQDRDSRITGRWLDDWETHLADRAGYVEDLQAGSEAPPVFTARGGRSITATIDNFAEVNDMASCVTPLDI